MIDLSNHGKCQNRRKGTHGCSSVQDKKRAAGPLRATAARVHVMLPKEIKP